MAITLDGSNGITTPGGATTDDITFADNDKAIFGAGSDLQVYHDGSNSYIDDAGTGNLYLRASNAIIMQSSDGAETIASFHDDNLCRLYYDNSIKLATTSTGVDVTGTVTSDGLTVTQSGSTTATIGATGASGDNDGTLIISNGGSGDGMLRFDYESNTDRARIGVSSSSQNLQFYTDGNNERMRIDSSGNVGIGTATIANESDHTKLKIAGASGTGGGIIEFADTSNNIDAALFVDNGNLYVVADRDNATSDSSIRFRVDGSSEKMSILSDGKVRVGTQIQGQSFTGSQYFASLPPINSSIPAMYLHRSGGDGSVADFACRGTVVGSVSVSGSSTSYNTSSDYRLKENVVDLTGASARVNQLNPSRFNFIADDTNTLVDGFLAHEVATVVPEAITGTKDAIKDEEYEVTPAVLDDDGNVTTEAVMGTRSVPDYQGIDQSKLVPLLTAALQEALTEITSLKTRVQALEA